MQILIIFYMKKENNNFLTNRLLQKEFSLKCQSAWGCVPETESGVNRVEYFCIIKLIGG